MTTTRPSIPTCIVAAIAASALLIGACNSKDSADEPLADAGLDPGVGGGGSAGGEGSLDGGGSSGTRGDGGGARADAGGGRDGSRPMQECPATAPANGSSCVSGRGDCTIGDTFCDCPSDTSRWLCWKPSDCPTTAPAEMSACGVAGMECEIGAGDAGGAGLDCECTESGWDCGRQVCPASEPAAAGACESGDGTCSFANGRICDCRSRQWVCWNQSDCPAMTPSAGAACPVLRMLCEYASGDCDCSAQGWSCEGQPRPRDGGTPDAGARDAGARDGAANDAGAGDAATDNG